MRLKQAFLMFSLLLTSALLNAQTPDPRQIVREIWQGFLQLGNYNQERHVLMLGDEISPGRYTLLAIQTSEVPNEPGTILAQAEWQEEARFESAIASIWRTELGARIETLLASEHYYVAGVLHYNQRAEAMWAMVHELTVRTLDANSVRLLPFAPHGIGKLDEVIIQATDFAAFGNNNTSPSRSDGSPLGWVDPRVICTCWNGRPPNTNVKVGATVDWDGFAPPSPPTLPVPATKGVGDFDDPRTVLWPWPNIGAGVLRHVCRSGAWEGQNLNMLIGGSLGFSAYSGCLYMGLANPILGGGCALAVVVGSVLAGWGIFGQVGARQQLCDQEFCFNVINVARRTWHDEAELRQPRITLLIAQIADLSSRIRQTENNIDQLLLDLARTTDPEERRQIQAEIDRQRAHLQQLQMQLQFRQAELEAAFKAQEPWRNKKTSCDWCIRPLPGGGG